MSVDDRDPRITWIAAHMQRHFAEPMAIPDLAALVNLSASHVRALFTAQTGAAPAQFLRRLRLRRARILIEHTCLGVTEIMTAVGYDNPSHFARDFRAVHGLAPGSLQRTTQTARPSGPTTF
jgi:transcriptional regulator GlxA family with amidase domain